MSNKPQLEAIIFMKRINVLIIDKGTYEGLPDRWKKRFTNTDKIVGVNSYGTTLSTYLYNEITNYLKLNNLW